MEEDARLFKRFKKHNLVKLSYETETFFGTMEDISMMGASIATENSLYINQELVLESYFFTKKIDIKVVRLHIDGRHNEYGVMFHNLDEEISKEIYQLITSGEK